MIDENKEVSVKEKKKIERTKLLEVAEQLCHFSSKLTNTNLPCGGIRLSSDVKSNHPYISVSTLGAANVPVDYVTGATDSPAFKEIAEIKDSDEEISAILKEGNIVGLNALTKGNVRLRQVIFNLGEKGEVALTPLSSTGLSSVLRQKTAAYYENDLNYIKNLFEKLKSEKNKDRSPIDRGFKSALRPIRTSLMSFGGANPQNAGFYLISAKRPLLFELPKESADYKHALKVYHSGLNIKIGLDNLTSYKSLIRKTESVKAIDQFKKSISRSDLENEEALIIKNIIASIFSEAKHARILIEKNLEINKNPQKGEVESSCIADCHISKCLLDKSERDKSKDWQSLLAKKLVDRLLNAKLYNKETGARESLGISSDLTATLVGKFKKEIRCQQNTL